MPKLMRTEEAARYLRIHPETLRKKVRAREIPAFKVGREWRFAKSQLEDWLMYGGFKLRDTNEDPHTARARRRILKQDEVGIGYLVPRIQGWAYDEMGHGLTENELVELQEAITEKYGPQIELDILDFIESAAGTASAPDSVSGTSPSAFQ